MIEASWLEAITRWAETKPRILSVYLFGSRAKGTHREDSDLDLAIILTHANESAETYWTFEADRLVTSLAPKLPVTLDLQVALGDDRVVMPAVREHGVLLYLCRF